MTRNNFYNKPNCDPDCWSWNPLAMRCDRVSAGCENCWHLSWIKRFGHCQKNKYKRAAYMGGIVWLDKKELDAPARKRETGVICVQFMGDLWHEKVGYIKRERILTMAWDVRKKHTFLFLTKRPQGLLSHSYGLTVLWYGVSIENQSAVHRAETLASIPGINRWLSVEPMLGPIAISAMTLREFGWVVCGPETGSGKRPFKYRWAEELYKQCHAARIPFYWKGNPDAGLPRERPF